MIDQPELRPAPPQHPSVDVVTARRAILLVNRPVIGLSSWLVDALSRFTPAGLVVTLVTGPDTRVTLPVRTLIASRVMQWVIQSPDGGFYDGLDGLPQRFDVVEFVARSQRPVPQFLEVRDHPCWQVLTTLTVEHRADLHTELGLAVEQISTAFGGGVPRGWGLHEPVTEAWDRIELTAVARRRMPTELQLAVVGPQPDDADEPAETMVAALTAQRTSRGVEEQVTALSNGGPVTRSVAEIREVSYNLLAAAADTQTVGFAWTHLRPGLADLTEPARARPEPAPTAVLIGPRAVRALGKEILLRAPLPAPEQVGSPRAPALLWRLGANGTPGWEELAGLVRHLRPERIVEVAPQLAEALGVERSTRG